MPMGQTAPGVGDFETIEVCDGTSVPASAESGGEAHRSPPTINRAT